MNVEGPRIDVNYIVVSIFSAVTSGAGGVFETVTCMSLSFMLIKLISYRHEAIGGSQTPFIPFGGGQAITLATSGAGVVTSFGGSEYTAATAAAASVASSLHSNAARGVEWVGFTSPMFFALLSVVGGTFFGAWITLFV